MQKFEEEYHKQLAQSKVSLQTQFEYAWCLVRSSYYGDIRKGIMLLEDLFKNEAAQDKRDYLYYLAIGYARIKVCHTGTSDTFLKIYAFTLSCSHSNVLLVHLSSTIPYDTRTSKAPFT